MINLAQDDGLWTVTLDRPDKANALTKAMLSDLLDIVHRAKDEARALILTGAGRVYSAGADLEEAPEGITDPVWEKLSGAIADLPILTIAALNGTCAGGALGMVLACDLRVAVPRATFFYPVMKLGFLPQPSDPVRLAELVGPARARLVLLAGQRIDADEALRIGLVDAVVAEDELIDRARSWAADALAADRGHVAAIKAMIPQRLRRAPGVLE